MVNPLPDFFFQLSLHVSNGGCVIIPDLTKKSFDLIQFYIQRCSVLLNKAIDGQLPDMFRHAKELFQITPCGV